jgi:hypothetical protein
MKYFIRGDGAFVEESFPFSRADAPCTWFKSVDVFLCSNYPELNDQSQAHYNIFIRFGIKKFLTIVENLKIDVRGKTFLDLGCGADPPNDYPGKRVPTETGMIGSNYPHKPWLARSMQFLGARTIGTDIGNLSGEAFEHHQLDLMVPNSLDFIASESVDIVHSSLLDCSPTLYQHYGKRNISEILFPQISRVLKEGGYCITDMTFKELENLSEYKMKIV